MGRLRKLGARFGIGRESELGGFAADTAYVATWQAANSVGDLLQIVVITHSLGLDDYGRLAIATSLVALVGKFFDVQVGVAATTYGASALRAGPAAARGVFRFSYLIDGATGIAAIVVLLPVAVLAGPGLVGADGAALIGLCAAAQLMATVNESSISILRLAGRFRLVATYTVAIEAVRIGLLAAAVLTFDSVVAAAVVLIAYQAMLGGANLIAATKVFRAETGEPLARRGGSLAPETRRGILRTVFSTNLVSYTKLTQTQLPTVVVGGMLGSLDAGLYKLGMSASSMIGRLADPARLSLLPRLARLWASGRREDAWRFLVRASRVSIPIMVFVAAAVILLREPVLSIIGGSGSDAAAGVLVAGAVAWAIDGALFWNSSLLFTAGRAGAVAAVAVVAALVQVAALWPLTDALGPAGAALAFLISVGLANVLYTVLALRLIRRGSSSASAEIEPAMAALELEAREEQT